MPFLITWASRFGQFYTQPHTSATMQDDISWKHTTVAYIMAPLPEVRTCDMFTWLASRLYNQIQELGIQGWLTSWLTLPEVRTRSIPTWLMSWLYGQW